MASEDEFIMLSYCGATFGLSVLLFVLRKLLVRDAANSRLSRAQEYVRPVEVQYYYPVVVAQLRAAVLATDHQYHTLSFLCVAVSVVLVGTCRGAN